MEQLSRHKEQRSGLAVQPGRFIGGFGGGANGG
jgi:hypothetical protein